MANLSVEICGVKFRNPVIAASGTYGFGREFDEVYDISQIGGISTKGLTVEPRLGNPVPRIAEGDSVILNAVGLQNPGVEKFIRDDLDFLKSKGIVISVLTDLSTWSSSTFPAPTCVRAEWLWVLNPKTSGKSLP